MKDVHIDNTFDELWGADIRVRVRHGSPDLPCPAVSLADAVKALLTGTEQIHFFPSAAMYNGWRDVLVMANGIIMDEDVEKVKGYNNVLKKQVTDRDPQRNISLLILSVKDDALNYILEKRNSLQLLTDYVATPGYEDFTIRLFPAASIDKILKGLTELFHEKQPGEVKLVEKNLRHLWQFRPIPSRMDMGLVLSEDETKILMVCAETGWYEYPRPKEATLASISEGLGISAPTLLIRLRNINRKLSEEYFRRYVIPR